MEQEYPTLNGIEPSWADLSVSFPIYGGITHITKGIKGVKWNDGVEVGEVREPGSRGGVVKTTTGRYSCECSMTFYRSAWRQFKKALAQKNKRISIVGFDLIILHTPPGEEEIYNTKLSGLRVLTRGQDMTEGVEPDTIEIAMHCKLIEEEGITLL